ncbi:hypothetical protein EMPS_06770 [Entomortierella parvispora]|uniref:SAP domain-containing protein n=1 Tax=Entomortierella parvispora TaxID=205924 RepID=A0A9P3HD34_9FUNG|nr:hypothetical protein EMPS_06770 [Entomortierella parvispora]
MSTPALSRRRKQELKDVAQSLGIADDGTREDLVERIKNHISSSGDSSLSALLREETPDRSAGNSRRSSLENVPTTTTSTKSSPRKKITITETTTTKTSGGKSSTTSHSNYSHGLSEHQVSNFIDHMQDELHDAKDLAKQLEETLHAKFTTGNSSSGKGTRSSGRMGSTSKHTHSLVDSHRHTEETEHGTRQHLEHRAADFRKSSRGGDEQGATGHASRRRGSHSSKHDHDAHESHHREHGSHHRSHHGAGGIGAWWHHLSGTLQHRLSRCLSGSRHGGASGLSACMQKKWKRLQDLGSTSKGLVWLTFLLELGVFFSQAYSYFHQHHHNAAHEHGHGLLSAEGHFHDWLPSWISSYFTSCWVPHCLSFLTNWPHFLQPFFSYYGTLFLLPTLLSQLFNVDRSSHSATSSSSSSSSDQHLTGLLAKRTTSGLSYFVFKFALTYLLGHSAGLRSVLGVAGGAGRTGTGGLWSGCKYISEVFRYVPQSLGLATSGAGTVLALAESIVQSARKK